MAVTRRRAKPWAPRRGVTRLRSAEGPSLRSHPRWTTAGERRTARLLDRLIVERRDRPTRAPRRGPPP